MTPFRIETNTHGHHFIAGGILPERMMKPGQRWVAADGSNHVVTIFDIREGCVAYKFRDRFDQLTWNEKDNFSFQCRYCLVVDTPELPPELTKDTNG